MRKAITFAFALGFAGGVVIAGAPLGGPDSVSEFGRPDLVRSSERAAERVFTIEQATAGKAAYAKSCASCHLPDLSGSNEIPALAGQPFKDAWGARTTKELFDYMSAAMPYGGPSLSTDSYASILAYILQFSGAMPGARALDTSTVVRIDSLTTAEHAPSAP
jgi:mono/diheme cytochrome c family protein